MNVSRRLVLATAVGVGIAGCTSPGSDDSATNSLAIRVQNRTDSDHVVSATVADPDGEVLERVTEERVSANVGTTFESTGYGSGPYTVRVRGDSWATSGLWDPGACSDYAFTTTLEEADGRPAVTATAACSTSE